MRQKYWTAAVLLLGIFWLLLPGFTFAETKQVYVIPIEETVENGLSAFVDKSLDEAEANQADFVIFEVNTPGGLVDSAGKIASRIAGSHVKTAAFVNNQALSAGAYICLNADKIYMVPNATLGSAAVIDSAGNTADKKVQSYWSAAMRTSAEQNGRDPVYAEAMADESINLPEYGAEKGKLLTFTAEDALKAGYSEGTVKDLDELLNELNLSDADVSFLGENALDKLVRFLTNPYVVTILLMLAAAGIVIELFLPGFGIGGSIGVISILLYFYGHIAIGTAGYQSLLLFGAGIILCVLELFLPGGIAGALGLGAVIVSLFTAGDNMTHTAWALLAAVIAAVLAGTIMVKVFGKRMKLFRKIILTDSTNTEQGYVSNVNRKELLGMEGLAVTDLRPAGTAVIADERLDVVTEGSFISKGTTVTVVKTEGMRIVVRETKISKSK